MGKLEHESRKRSQRQVLRKLVLESVKVAGFISIALVAFPVVGAMAKMGMIPSKRQKEVIKNSCNKLIQAGLLKQTEKGMRLTKKGEIVLRQLELRDYRIKKPKHWDKKWRVIIFDVPHYRTSVRNKIRRTLQAVGFMRLQDSVWIYPYDCEDLIILLKADFKVGKDLIYMIVDSLQYDSHIKKNFGLQ